MIRSVILFIMVILVTGCGEEVDEHRFNKEAAGPEEPLPPITVVVLSPYDRYAGKGISPATADHLRRRFRMDSAYRVLPFFPEGPILSPNNVFDKKYCEEIITRMDPDVIMMTRHELQKLLPDMYSSLWGITIKCFLPHRDTTVVIYDRDSIPRHKVDKEIFGRPILRKLDSLLRP